MSRRIVKYTLLGLLLVLLFILVVGVVRLRSESRAFDRLQKPVTMDIKPMPMKRIVQRIERDTGVDVKADWKALAEVNIRPDTAVPMKQIDDRAWIGGRSTLKLLHQRTWNKVGYTIRGDTVLISTTERVGKEPPSWLNTVYDLMP